MSNKYCPICGEENNCMAGAEEHGNCWCDKEIFPNGVFDLVPVESQKKHCICKNCLSKYIEEQKINNACL